MVGPSHGVYDGRTTSFARPLPPGRSLITFGLTRSLQSPSVSWAVSATSRGVLPALWSRSLCRPRRRPRDVRGRSSTASSLYGAISRSHSSTAARPGSSEDIARNPTLRMPADTYHDRGGLKRTTARPSVFGKSERTGGSISVHAAAGPSTSILYSSTTRLWLWRRSSSVTSPPGSTASWCEVSTSVGSSLMSISTSGIRFSYAPARVRPQPRHCAGRG